MASACVSNVFARPTNDIVESLVPPASPRLVAGPLLQVPRTHLLARGCPCRRARFQSSSQSRRHLPVFRFPSSSPHPASLARCNFRSLFISSPPTHPRNLIPTPSIPPARGRADGEHRRHITSTRDIPEKTSPTPWTPVSSGHMCASAASNVQRKAESLRAGRRSPKHVNTLPVGWESHKDSTTGHLYYYNATTNVTTWERPGGASPADDDGMGAGEGSGAGSGGGGGGGGKQESAVVFEPHRNAPSFLGTGLGSHFLMSLKL